MASDDYTPDEVEKSSKRHKHRRHHRHHHGSKKRDDVNKLVSEDIESSPPFVDPIRSSMIGSSRPDDDVEEGEILDEDGFGGGVDEIQEKKAESHAGYKEFEDVGVQDRSDNWDLKDGTDNWSSERQYRKSRILGMDHNDDHLVCISSMDKEAKNRHNETGNEFVSREFSRIHVNGDLDYQSLIEDKRPKESGLPPGGRSERNGHGDDGKSDGDANKLSNKRKLLPVRTLDKYKTIILSPLPDRYRAEVPEGRKRSRSVLYDHAKERSCSESVMEEEALLKRRSYREKDVLDDERVVRCCDVADSVSDDDRDHSSSYGAQYAVQEKRHGSKEASVREISNRERSRERDVDRDRRREREVDREGRREKERARSREREVDRDRRRETHARTRDRKRRRERELDRERSRERELDSDQVRQKERAGSCEKEIDVDYRREMEQERSRDRRRERVRDSSRDIYQDRKSDRSHHRVKSMDRSRDSEREREIERTKHSDRIMDRTGERQDDHEMGKEREKYDGSEDVHRNRNSRHDVKFYSLDKSRDEDEQDYEESATLHPDQEQDDLDRIKEESRRRRQAILEKYKKQQTKPETESKPQSKEAEKDRAPVVHSSQPAAISNAFPEGKNDDDIFVAEPALYIGKSPPPNGVAGAGGLGEGSPKSERLDNNFCDDIFGETPTGVRKCGKENGVKIERSGLNDNWDDAEGYYSYRFGELLDGRYEITAAHGKGVFSTVVRAKNLKAAIGEPEEVAVKIIRSNDTMYKAGMTELVILKKLAGQDPENKRHCVRFLSSFKYRNHLCLVFESLNMNLREVLKKFGRNIGLKLTAVRAYAKQLFIALKHLKNCGVLHCDIKPDNMLVNEAKNVLKLCDFGNAMFAGKNEITPYLVSRFYRAPEIILGLHYDHPLDIWSVGCCLYEVYTGKVLFPGATNNDMLRLHMELKGPFPKKMLRKGAFIDQHFDHDLNFHATEEDPVTKKAIKRLILSVKPKDIGSIITGSAGEDPKMLADFKDLLDKIFILDPDKRLTASQVLSHPFITGK